MTTKYLQKNKHNKNMPKMLGVLDLLYDVCQATCCILIVYFCWYVEAYGNMAYIVNGSFVLMCGCIFAIWAIEGIIHTDDIPYGIWHQFYMVLYCLITGVFIAYDQSSFMHSIRQYLVYCLIMYAICLVSKYKESYNWFVKTINFSVLICCIHLVGWGYHYTTNRIVLSANSNPNLLGTILNLGLFAVLINFQVSFKSLALCIPQVCLILYNVIMTGSRKSLIVSIGLIVIWAYSIYKYTMENGNQIQKIIVLFIILCAILALYYYYNTFVIHTAVFDRMQTMGNEESNGVRIEMYNESINIFLDNPLFGGGLDQYKFLSGRGGYSHSTYAEAIADFGILGFFFYLYPFTIAVWQAYKFAFIIDRSYCSKYVFGLCIVEVFLGAVQIWFIEISHFFAWTMIFLVLQDIQKHEKCKKAIGNMRYIRYVRNKI